MSFGYSSERRAAVEAVLNACRLCESVHQSLATADTMAKQDRSPVTVADFGAQALVSLMLARDFPAIPLMAEEHAGELRGSAGADVKRRVLHYVDERAPGLSVEDMLGAIDRGSHAGTGVGPYWVLDPIDGTMGFLRHDQYAVALALVKEGRVVLGVLGCPQLPVMPEKPGGPAGCLFIAVRGRGTVVRAMYGGSEAPVHVAATREPGEATLCESVEAAHSSHEATARVIERLGVRRPPMRMDSQCKYAAVARGDAAIYLRLPTQAGYRARSWDHAAGSILVEEAGGCVTDVDGQPLDFSTGRRLENNRGTVATNGILHQAVLDAIRTVLRK